MFLFWQTVYIVILHSPSCCKINPWLNMFHKQCVDISPEEHNSIDEQILFFRRTGIKNLILDTEGDVVVKLCETLPPNQNYKKYLQPFFSSAPLVLKLLQRQIFLAGTLHSCSQLKDKKSFVKRGRGSVDARVEKEEGTHSLSSGVTTDVLS